MDTTQIYNVAHGFLGLKEFPAARHNPEIVKMFADSGHAWVKDDETPWCAAFVGSVLAQVGLQGTQKLNARSYLEWGREVPLQEARKGDVVVLWRGSRNGWQGHVGFFDRVEGDNIYILGGNQGNSVSIAPYNKDRLLAVRTIREPRTHVAQSKTVQATIAQSAGVATAGITAVAALDGTAQMVVIGALALVAVAGMVIFKERLRKWRSGDR